MTASDIEMDDLSKRVNDQSVPTVETATAPDAVSAFWAWSTASLLSILALILSGSPRLLLFLSSEPAIGVEKRAALTPLESFLAVHAAIWLFAVAVSLVLNVPSTPAFDVPPPHHQTSRHPLLIPLTLAGILSSFCAYNTNSVGSLATIVFVGSGITGLWGTWAAIFGNSSSVSKKTGADKHTSSFLFGNKFAASAQKKEWLKKRRT
ncbi:hypothetical protein C8R47DRAFT_1115374 [Mycena vitilis]|nr:hypothetical protein C8R47DRAFT_1115374 [Mycena vitilis]